MKPGRFQGRKMVSVIGLLAVFLFLVLSIGNLVRSDQDLSRGVFDRLKQIVGYISGTENKADTSISRTATIDQASSTVRGTPSPTPGLLEVPGFSGTASGISKISIVAITGLYTGPTDLGTVGTQRVKPYLDTDSYMPMVLHSVAVLGGEGPTRDIPVVNKVWQSAGIMGMRPGILTIFAYDASIIRWEESFPLTRTVVYIVE